MGRTALYAAAACLLAAAPVAGQSTHNGRLGQLDVSIPKLPVEVEIDGRLDEAQWSRAAMLTGFSQYAPVDGVAAQDSTEVFVMYADQAIYFGVRAYEPHGTPQARLSDRDRIGSDDHVLLILDTFDDQRRALVFGVNAMGVQNDGTLNDGSGGIDLSPDFLWESKGRVTEFGYEAEIRIPFKSMRYQDTDVQQWGVQVLRVVQHSGHEQTWTPAQRALPSFLSQSGRFKDMTQLRRGLVLDVNPVMTARAVGSPRTGVTASPGDWRYRNDDPEFGGNVRWGVTPNLTLNATANPDFSQVESDVGQVVFDPRQALSFPEKRPFFLEGNEYFQVPNGLIYTRRIVAPEAAAKLNGKVGNMNVGFLSAIDDDAGTSDNPIYNVLRLRRDLGDQSNVGFVYTDRIQGDAWNRVAGADTRLLIAGNRFVFNGQVAASFTGDAAGSINGRPMFDMSLTKPGREWGFSTVIEGVHPEFVAGSGFISRSGIAHVNIQPRRTFFPENSFIETISFSPIIDGQWEWDRFTKGTFPNDLKLNTSTNAVLRGGWRTTFYTWAETFKYPAYLYTNYYLERRDAGGAVIDTVPYSGTDRLKNFGVMTAVNTPQWRQFSASAEILGGQDDNFEEWSSAWILFSTINVNWQPTDKLRINARYLEQRVNRKSDGSQVSLSMIPRVKVEYQLSRPIFFRFVGQYNSRKVDALRDDSRTESPILRRSANGTFSPVLARESGGFRADWLFSYQPNPGTVFFAGYGSSLNGTEYFRPGELERTSDGFFVKLSYLFRM